MTRRDRALVGTVVVLVVVASVLGWAWSSAAQGADLPELKAAIEAWQALIAIAVASLLYGRVRRTGTLNDAALVASMVLLAGNSALVIVSLSRSFGPDAVNGITWSRVVVRLLASITMAGAAVLPDRDVRAVRPALMVLVGAGLVLVPGVVAASGAHLPVAVVRRASGTYQVDAAARVALVVVVLLVAAATLGFARRARLAPEPMNRALALGGFVATFSWIEFVGRPTVYTQEVYVGDVLRLGFWLVLLAGATREVTRWWHGVTRAAVIEERRRIARDVHDGLAQELAFITQLSGLLLEGDAPPDAQVQVVSSAQRALDESRRAIAALRDVDREPLGVLLGNAAAETAARFGALVEVDVDPRLELPIDAREALVRIVREAVANAGRHGGANEVRVTLGPDRVLRVTDDGVGFDPTVRPSDGRYGLVSMQERAEGIGATLAIHRSGGGGTEVEVTLH